MPEQLHSLPCVISSPVFEKTIEGTGVDTSSFSSSSADRTGQSPLFWLCQFLSLADQLVYRSWNNEYKDKPFYPGLSQELCYIYWFHTIKEGRKFMTICLTFLTSVLEVPLFEGWVKEVTLSFQQLSSDRSPIKPRITFSQKVNSVLFQIPAFNVSQAFAWAIS